MAIARMSNLIAFSQFQRLMTNKGLNYEEFRKESVSLRAPIADHTAILFKHIYSKPYKNADKENKETPRPVHGIQHVGRVAFYIPVLANLYRKYGDEEAKTLTEESIKLIQIATLLHDSAREDDGEDKWDNESALFVYFYLTDILHIDAAKAQAVAEAVVNKDHLSKDSHHPYYRLARNALGELEWKKSDTQPIKRNIYQKLIGDADRLDIIRARAAFDAEYLDFHQDIAQHNRAAFEDQAKLIIEARSLIHLHGDAYLRLQHPVKQRFHQVNAYQLIEKSVDPGSHPLLSALKNTLLTPDNVCRPLFKYPAYDQKAGATETNMQAALYEGRILSRAIDLPSAVRNKASRPAENELMADLEIRKTLRRLDVPTRTRKKNKFKDGNPNRSVSLLDGSNVTFNNSGFLILDPQIKDIVSVSTKDTDSGRSKKHDVSRKDSDEKIKNDLNKLKYKTKMGGDATAFMGNSYFYVAAHNEVVYHIRNYDAIFYTYDPNAHGYTSELEGTFSPELQAVFIQNAFKQATGFILPIYEYSGIHNKMILRREFSEQEIITMWEKSCTYYIKKKLKQSISDIQAMSLDQIKVESVYESNLKLFAYLHELKAMKTLMPADANYSSVLKTALSMRLALIKNNCINERMEELKKIVSEDKSRVMSDKKLFLDVIDQPILLKPCKDEIQKSIQAELKANQFFTDTSRATRLFILAHKLNLDTETQQIKSAAESALQSQSSFLTVPLETFLKPPETVLEEIKKESKEPRFTLH